MTRTEYLAQLDNYLKKLPAKDYQEAIKGPINYVALGDQYASLYNDVDGG